VRVTRIVGLLPIAVSLVLAQSKATPLVDPSNAPTSGLNFSAAVQYSSGGNGPNAVAIADVNGDKKPDLVVANWCTDHACTGSSVGVLLGNGDGTFQNGVAYGSGGLYADSVAVADLNGDGHPDIVVANCGSTSGGTCAGASGNVGVLLGNGDGTFRPVVNYQLNGGGFGSTSVVLADMNGDGKLDLVVAAGCSRGACVGVLLGNGDGTFQTELPPNDSGGLYAFTVAVKDVNGDGKPDVVVANLCTNSTCTASSVGVLLNRGDGTFKPALTYDSGGLFPDGIAIADVNGDGKPDIIVADSSGNQAVDPGVVAVLLGNGDGTFQTPVPYSSGAYGAAGVAYADMNGDGKRDMVVANCSATSGSCTGGGGDVGVLLGKGGGTFQAPITFAPGGNTPFGIAVKDLNGDKEPDIVVANCASDRCSQAPGTVGVLINASLTATATALSSSPNPSKLGQAVTFTAQVAARRGFHQGIPTGAVSFYNGKTKIGDSTLDSHGVTTFTTSKLSKGTHHMKATYNGDANFVPSTSRVLLQVVQ
jgi:hypothetical protein